MCDICVLPCVSCGKDIDVHIGDFSVDRRHVHPFCKKPKCQQLALDTLHGKRYMHDADSKKCFGRAVTYIVFGETGIKGEKQPLFLVDWPRQVHTND